MMIGQACGSRSIPTAEGGFSLPITALIPLWNRNSWEAGSAGRMVQSLWSVDFKTQNIKFKSVASQGDIGMRV